MSRLQGKVEIFDAIDGGSITDGEQRAKLLSNCMAPARLELRIDAQVMLIKNTDETLVNGSMGKVIQFVDPASCGKDGREVLGGGKDGKKANTALGYKPYPVVEFLLPNGSTKEFLVLPEIWKVELPNGEVQASRSQVGSLPVTFRLSSSFTVLGPSHFVVGHVHPQIPRADP
jgi:ATP-dependent DNA helicase PIF1